MTVVNIPYANEILRLRVPDRNFLMLALPKEIPGSSSPELEVKRAVLNPINAEPLRNVARGKKTVAIVVDDATRPVPTNLILPPILEELHEAGIHRENITIIFATGLHRPVTREEAYRLLGAKVAERYRWISHNADSDDLVYLGTTSRGTPLYINRLYVESDLKLLIGDIMLHYYAGFGGGGKSILPGIAGRETIIKNHSMMFHPNAKPGVYKGNPVCEDIMEAAKIVGTDFVVNVVLNSRREIVKVFAGELESVFLAGIDLAKKMYMVEIPQQADIVIVSPGGHPFDINLYQAHKALFFAEQATRLGGVIMLVAACPEGAGNELFKEWMIRMRGVPADEAMRRIESELKKNFVIGPHKAYYIIRATSRYRIYIKTEIGAEEVADIYRMHPMGDPQEVLDGLLAENPDAKVLVIPYGNETLPVLRQ